MPLCRSSWCQMMVYVYAMVRFNHRGVHRLVHRSRIREGGSLGAGGIRMRGGGSEAGR